MEQKEFDKVFNEELIRHIYFTARKHAADDLQEFYNRMIDNLPSEDESQKIIKDWTIFLIF